MEEKIKETEGMIKTCQQRKKERDSKLNELLEELKHHFTSTMNEISIRQWKISVKEKENSYLQKRGILTMDSKFYITENGDEISGEFNLVEADVVSVDEFGEIVVRQKK